MGDFLGFTKALHGIGLHKGCAGRFPVFGVHLLQGINDHLRHDGAGRDGIDPDIILTILNCGVAR